jgi:hypothetical protein
MTRPDKLKTVFQKRKVCLTVPVLKESVTTRQFLNILELNKVRRRKSRVFKESQDSTAISGYRYGRQDL